MPTTKETFPEVVPLDALRRFLRVTSNNGDVTRDLSAALAVAVAEIDGPGLLGRAMVAAEYRFVGPRPVAGKVALAIGPVRSVVSVEYVDTSGGVREFAGPVEVISDGERCALSAAWPHDMADRPDALRVRYVAGMAEDAAGLPAPLVQAVLLLAAHRFDMREEVIIGAAASRVPLGVDRLVGLYRVGWFG